MSNIVEFEARATMERQAREWLIRLDGDEPLSDAERENFQRWLESNPSHREELGRLAKFWDRANILTELAVPLGGAAAGGSARQRWNSSRWMAVAGVVLVAITLGTWRLNHADGAANGTYGTALGQQQTVSLVDGSTIELNTDSQVLVDYGEGSRKIRLLRGEALFTVTHNPKRPFEVYAADSMIRAVGTAFSVHVSEHEVNVTVTKGVVEVADVERGPAISGHTSTEQTMSLRKLGTLKAGDTTWLRKDHDQIDVQPLAEADLKRRMAWQEGYLEFSGQPLSEVVLQVNRYSPVTLTIGDPKLASVAIGGRFRIGDLDAVLDVLHSNFAIQSTRLDERSIRLDAATPR